jgi:D-methionine transport system substrate-binding protein
MKKSTVLFLSALSVIGLASCKTKVQKEANNVITVAASESPHAKILNEAVKPLLAAKGYTLEVTVLDWTLQNDAVSKGDYDANYFQHRPYLQQFDSGSANYVQDYTYTKVFPAASVHYEPLRIYAGKSAATDFETKKKTATYEICSDVSNEIRALDLLKVNGVIDDYETDKDGNPINLPKNITLIDENQLVAQKDDYDYAVLPCNTALTGNLNADSTLPVEGGIVADRNANIIAANVKYYKKSTSYKTKIDVLVEAVLDPSVATFIRDTWQGVIAVNQQKFIA